MFSPEFMQRPAFQRSIAGDALGFRSIDDFPRFTGARIWRQFFAKVGFKSATAPHALHENRLETNRLSEIALAHVAILGTVAAAARHAIAHCGGGCWLHYLVRRRHACHHSMRSFLKYWLPIVIWSAVIFIGSTDLMSAEHTSRIIAPLLRWLNPEISAEAIAEVQFCVRKAAHLTEYAILAMLLWRSLRLGTNLQMKMSILFITVWMGCAILAATDEFHQSFVPSRTASPIDVMIDICGALIGLTICWAFSMRRKPQTH
jgi:VanZ family protein